MMTKKGKNKKSFLLLFICLTLLQIGCEKKGSSPPPPAVQAKPVVKSLPPVQEQLSSAKVTVSPTTPFDFSNKKDPFKPIVAEAKKLKPETKSGSSFRGLPIQNYEVNQFKVLGIITGLKENNALVVDPAGKAYVVKPGMEIGKNNGRITRIDTASIEVFEQFRDEEGKPRKRTVRITLPRKE